MTISAAKGKGVRTLNLNDQLPNCEIIINKPIYNLKAIASGKRIVDIGCGHGHNKILVEKAGGEWVGVEPFEGGAHTVIASAEDLPFSSESFDIAIMDAVLEHVPDVGKAFSEVSRILKPGGQFIGYAAFMECFHEISYSHLSFKALEYYSNLNGMQLQVISGGGRFGIDYHLNILLKPIPFSFGRKIIAFGIRNLIRLKSSFGYIYLRLFRKYSHKDSKEKSIMFYKLECLRQSNGFSFIIKKNDSNSNNL